MGKSAAFPVRPIGLFKCASSFFWLFHLVVLAFSMLLMLSFRQRFLTIKEGSHGNLPRAYFIETACRGRSHDLCTYYQHSDTRRREDPCRPDEYTAWDEWRGCVTRLLVLKQWKSYNERGTLASSSPVALSATTTVFEKFILQHSDHLPWSLSPNVTIVLLEFRAQGQKLAFTVRNAIDNLPIHWPLQVVGGPSICRTMTQLFPVEVAAGKIVLTDLGTEEQHDRESINRVYTDSNFYNKLLGSTWLFIQVDSVICKSQRHLLKSFIQKDCGWWGAPWSVWDRHPRIGGNGGFSLRKKDFIESILTRFQWDGVTPEDWWFCNKGADIYNDLPTPLRPATMEDELLFSSESIFSERSFGIHKYWISLPPDVPQMRTLLENCPEALGMFPTEYLGYTLWHDMVCSLNVTRESFDPGTNITFDFGGHCPPRI